MKFLPLLPLVIAPYLYNDWKVIYPFKPFNVYIEDEITWGKIKLHNLAYNLYANHQFKW